MMLWLVKIPAYMFMGMLKDIAKMPTLCDRNTAQTNRKNSVQRKNTNIIVVTTCKWITLDICFTSPSCVHFSSELILTFCKEKNDKICIQKIYMFFFFSIE